jgi:hypothetical protein
VKWSPLLAIRAFLFYVKIWRLLWKLLRLEKLMKAKAFRNLLS